jgi:hypothetical protein
MPANTLPIAGRNHRPLLSKLGDLVLELLTLPYRATLEYVRLLPPALVEVPDVISKMFHPPCDTLGLTTTASVHVEYKKVAVATCGKNLVVECCCGKQMPL